MTQQIQVFHKPNGLVESAEPTQSKEKNNSHKLSSDLYVCPMACKDIRSYKNICNFKDSNLV